MLVIGDTVFAVDLRLVSPAGRCVRRSEAFGWQAEIAAEVGRFVEFGRRGGRGQSGFVPDVSPTGTPLP